MDPSLLSSHVCVPSFSRKMQSYGQHRVLSCSSKTLLWIAEISPFGLIPSNDVYRIDWADDVFSALKSLEVNLPDVVICDAAMLGLAGHSCLQLLTLHYPMVPIIALSDEQNLNRLMHFLREGISDVLFKSRLTSSVLLTAIEGILLHEDALLHDDVLSHWLMEEKTLSHRLNDLMSSTTAVDSLFAGLLPESPMQQGDWQCGYQVVSQAASNKRFLVDSVGLPSGYWLIYVVEVDLQDRSAVLGGLSLRALLSAYLKEGMAHWQDLDELQSILRMEASLQGILSYSVFFLVQPYPMQVSVLSNGLLVQGTLLNLGVSQPIVSHGSWVIEGESKRCRLWLMPPS